GLTDGTATIELLPLREAFKSDFAVTRVGNTYTIGFLGKTRQTDGGRGASSVKAIPIGLAGTASVVTRMDGIDYHGIERLDIRLGSGADVFNVQGTSAGSFKLDLDTVHAATNLSLGGGDDQVFVSSHADLDHATITATAGAADAFDFLTGDLEQVRGNLNIDAGAGRHRILVSDEADTTGDGTTASPVVITDVVVGPATGQQYDSLGAAEIQVKRLAFGDITYGAALADGNFFDGVVYWTGSGSDTIAIDGTHYRDGIHRTPTALNTGLGNDAITVDLDTPEDGFFVLHTTGGSASPKPTAVAAGVDDDTVYAADSTLPLIIFGGHGCDTIDAGQNQDIVFGDFGRVEYRNTTTGALIATYGFGGRGDVSSSDTIDPRWVFSTDRVLGGPDTIQGRQDQDVLIGGAFGDRIDGDEADDLIFGDAVELFRRDTNPAVVGDITDPRFRTLTGTAIYGRTGGEQSGQVLVDGVARSYRNPDGTAPAWAEYEIKNLYHSATLEANPDNSFGGDYIAGGAANDVIFGQLGDDTIQGDGNIEGTTVGASRNVASPFVLTPTLTVSAAGALTVNPSFEAATDGDDYIEGNGGSDVMFGNLGQDDLIGGSSSLYTLTTRELRPDGVDIIFGGAGTRIDRNNEVVATGDVALAERHARDADAIAGDNASIFRVVGVLGTPVATFVRFNYDNAAFAGYAAGRPIIPRAVQLLDYTPGGPDFDAASAALDRGGADEVHGESGDDAIYGMTASDVLFGDAGDDDLIGGWGHDWISGGTGQDGILGDDGRIFTSRNTTAGEPLSGVDPLVQLDRFIYTPGKIQQATINVTNALKKTVDLTPFNVTPKAQADDPLYDAKFADDVIYGGLGDDSMHGGAGDDAASGAEALPAFFARPVNPGNILRFDPTTEEFADYDEFDPLERIVPFLLDFDAADGPMVDGSIRSDGNDVLFGDLGNDWMVGGTGRDHLFGGWGSDLLNIDDDLSTHGGLNDLPDTHPSYEDIAYGGAGR
ncbi:MAG TPA: hypothetical protein VFG68_19225, partial [Fimbriiglobus sp.]|nr:hypothetical protein [Fimbriiglobus sp.]